MATFPVVSLLSHSILDQRLPYPQIDSRSTYRNPTVYILFVFVIPLFSIVRSPYSIKDSPHTILYWRGEEKKEGKGDTNCRGRRRRESRMGERVPFPHLGTLGTDEGGEEEGRVGATPLPSLLPSLLSRRCAWWRQRRIGRDERREERGSPSPSPPLLPPSSPPLPPRPREREGEWDIDCGYYNHWREWGRGRESDSLCLSVSLPLSPSNDRGGAIRDKALSREKLTPVSGLIFDLSCVLAHAFLSNSSQNRDLQFPPLPPSPEVGCDKSETCGRERRDSIDSSLLLTGCVNLLLVPFRSLLCVRFRWWFVDIPRLPLIFLLSSSFWRVLPVILSVFALRSCILVTIIAISCSILLVLMPIFDSFRHRIIIILTNSCIFHPISMTFLNHFCPRIL